MNTRKLTKIAFRDGQTIALPDDATDHEALLFEHELLARPWMLCASAKDVPWKEIAPWAEGLRVGGFDDWQPISPDLAFLIPDRSRAAYPFTDPSFLPRPVIWTGQEDHVPPAGYAWTVSLHNGDAHYWRQSYYYGALACRPGQFIGAGQ